MKVEVALGFFGGYGAILSIIVLYQTLVLQAVLDRTERSDREYSGLSRREQEQRRRRARTLLIEAGFFVIGVSAAFLLVASYSDWIASLVDPAEAPREAFTYATWVLRTLFLVVTAYYALRILSQPLIWRTFVRAKPLESE
jgi:hypothetical protein